jgi:hypothetical protein
MVGFLQVKSKKQCGTEAAPDSRIPEWQPRTFEAHMHWQAAERPASNI